MRADDEGHVPVEAQGVFAAPRGGLDADALARAFVETREAAIDGMARALEDENRQLKRAPNRDVVQPDGSVDSDALATLQTNAGKAGDMDGLIDMLYERGQIEEKAYKLLKAGDPKEVASAMKYMELLGGTAPTGGDSSEVAELKKQVAHLTSLFGDAGVLSDASQGADPALTDENELAKLGLRPKLDMGLSDMEKIQKDREKQRAEAVRQVRNFR